MDSIIVLPKVNPVLTLLPIDSGQVQLGQPVASVGISGQKAQYLPDVSSPQDGPGAGGVLLDKAAIMSALWKLTDKRGGDALDALLSSVIVKTRDLMDKVQTGQLLTNQERYRDALQEKRAKLTEAQKQVENALKAMRRSSIWSKIAGAFAIVASVVAIGYGAFLTVTGVGTGLGLAMMAGGVVGVITAADSLTAANRDGKGFLSDRAAIALAVVGVALALSTLPFGLAGSASTAAARSAGAAASSAAAKTAGAAASTTAKVANDAGTFVRITGLVNLMTATTTIGASSASIASAAISIDASKYSERAGELHADGQEIEAYMRQLYDFADILIKLLSDTTERYFAMLFSLRESMNDRSDSLSRAAV